MGALDLAPASARLFNCCTGGRAPDWSGYVSLFIGGCIDHDGHTEGGVRHDLAQFFTVYARDHDGLAEAITDTATGATLRQAAELGAELASLSGLPVTLCPTLEHGNGGPMVLRIFGPGDLSTGQARDAAAADRTPCPYCPAPDAVQPIPWPVVLTVTGFCALALLVCAAPLIVRTALALIPGA